VITELIDVLSEEPTFQAEESENSDLDEKITSDDLEKSSALSPLEFIPDITEFSDVSPTDSTLNLPEVNPIVTEFGDVFSEDLPDKLLLTCDIQHAQELIFPTCHIIGRILPHLLNSKSKLMSCKEQATVSCPNRHPFL